MFDPKNATPEQVSQLYMQYLGALAFLGEHTVFFLDQPEAEETVEQIFKDCHELTGVPYKRIIDRFELLPQRRSK